MSCLFCDRPFDPKGGPREKTEEHVFPDWSKPYLSSPLGPGEQWHWKAQGDEREEGSYPAFPAQQTVKGVCKECNGGWMSDTEVAVKPYLLPAMQGKGQRYSEKAQLALATWALKTALVVGAKGGYQPTPREFLHNLERKRAPDQKVRIWIGATPHPEMTYIDHRTLKIRGSASDEPPPAANGYATVLSIGHIAFYVIGWSVSKPRTEFVYRDFGGSMNPLWPSRGLVKWPPREILSRKGLDSLAARGFRWE